MKMKLLIVYEDRALYICTYTYVLIEIMYHIGHESQVSIIVTRIDEPSKMLAVRIYVKC